MNKSAELHRRRTMYSLLESWYGTQRAETEIAAHTAQPTHISDCLKSTAELLKSPDVRDFLRLQQQWSSIAGSVFTKYTVPVSLQNGVLTLGVRHSALLVELRGTTDLLLTKLNAEFGTGFCRVIELTVQ